MVCPKQPLGPNALSGNAARSSERHADARRASRSQLRVVAAERVGRARGSRPLSDEARAACEAGCAVVRAEDVEEGVAPLAPCLVQRAGEKATDAGSDAVARCVAVRGDGSGVERGRIALGEDTRYNLRLATDQLATIAEYTPPPPHEFDLADITLEVFAHTAAAEEDARENAKGEGGGGGDAARNGSCPPTTRGDAGSTPCVDASAVAAMFRKRFFGRVFATNELLLLPCPGDGPLLRLRVSEVNNMGEDEREEEPLYHCFRGRFTATTAIRLVAPGGGVVLEANAESADGWHGGRQQKQQQGGARRAATRVHVYTSDGEFFPVKKALLRPCIALTQAVRDASPDPIEVNVDVDCPTFDRVLLYLESEAMERADAYDFPLTLLPAMAAAADALSLRSLSELCARRKGEFSTRVREYGFDEVVAKNSGGGECWLILDGMVLDVTRWLPEHPGGSTIIPGQALNLDCSRFFEVYHASRESFLFLSHFYMGEIAREDAHRVPQPKEPPSVDFLEQLREYCGSFRINQEAATHLGAA